jgi:hypothetical protein
LIASPPLKFCLLYTCGTNEGTGVEINGIVCMRIGVCKLREIKRRVDKGSFGFPQGFKDVTRARTRARTRAHTHTELNYSG